MINWSRLREDMRRWRLENRAAGFDYVECERCSGTGKLTQGHSESDSHGSFWVPGEDCRCLMGKIKVFLSKAERLQAMKELAAELAAESE